MTIDRTLENLCINTIRFLAIDAVEKARSGHPGAPMGAAPFAFVLWDRFLKHNPADPKWPDRDRFVLSAGHASMLLYALLHLTGYDLTLEDIKQFRQWESRTPGHPEYGLTPGVEATTGPLGQGVGNAVGMAYAEKLLAAHYNRPGFDIINHRTYALVSDGDMQEGVGAEAASFAGAMKLGKLIFLYDKNNISIEGDTDVTFTEDVGQRYRGYGWRVIGPVDGMNTDEVERALQEAQAPSDRPAMIICRTVIGFGSPHKAGTGDAHGEPLGPDEVALTRKNLNWEYPPFEIPAAALAHFRQAQERGAQRWQEWQALVEAYRAKYPAEAAQLECDLRGELPPGWDQDLDGLFKEQAKPIATREASGRVINAIAQKVHGLTGGSADLAPSTKTLMKGHGNFGFEDKLDHNMHFGVREHGMGAVANGMALHGGLIPYTATFLMFYDYMRPAVRLAALSGQRVIFVYTHDSVGLGQDGPTHQPIEHLMGMRAVPNLVTLRPADAAETAESWRAAMQRRDGPTALILTRQNLPVLDRSALAPASGVATGGYVLCDCAGKPSLLIIATGSEVHIALEAGKQLAAAGIAARIVSLPSWELFDAQPLEYRNSVLPPDITKRVSIEAASPLGWEHYVGLEGIRIGVSRFGASAPGEVIYEQLGLTVSHVVEEANRLMQ